MLMLMRMRIDRLSDSSREDERKVCRGGSLSLSLSLSQEFVATMTIPILTFRASVRCSCALTPFSVLSRRSYCFVPFHHEARRTEANSNCSIYYVSCRGRVRILGGGGLGTAVASRCMYLQ